MTSLAAREAGAMRLDDAMRPLWVARYRLRITPIETLVLPYWQRGNILRGALGLALRRLVCHDLSLLCRSCPLYRQCPYPEVFEAAPPANGDRLRTFSDVPRPFVLDPPLGEQPTFASGEATCFGLTLVGRSSRHIAYFVAAFQTLADQGIGPQRARFRLDSVESIGARNAVQDVYRGTTEMNPLALPTRAGDLMKADDQSRSFLEILFRTPTDIRDAGRAVPSPRFGPLLRRLRDRASALSAFYGDAPLDLDFKALGDSTETVRLVEHRTRVVPVERPSTRTGQRHDIGGFVGTARYEGSAIGPLMPLVRLGEVIHVGKHAAFGNGWYEVADER